jgi:hypothetical protein
VPGLQRHRKPRDHGSRENRSGQVPLHPRGGGRPLGGLRQARRRQIVGRTAAGGHAGTVGLRLRPALVQGAQTATGHHSSRRRQSGIESQMGFRKDPGQRESDVGGSIRRNTTPVFWRNRRARRAAARGSSRRWSAYASGASPSSRCRR